jgi:hypothetical protein
MTAGQGLKSRFGHGGAGFDPQRTLGPIDILARVQAKDSEAFEGAQSFGL